MMRGKNYISKAKHQLDYDDLKISGKSADISDKMQRPFT